MNYLPKRQRGVTLIGWMLIIAVALFFAILGMRMVPSYLEYFSIVEVMSSIEKQHGGQQRPNINQIRGEFNKKIYINGVYEFDPKSMSFTREKGGLIFKVEYDIQKEVVGNVSVIMHFKNEVKL